MRQRRRSNVVTIDEQPGAIRFVAVVTPRDDVLDAARKRGWTEASDDSPHDVVDTDASATTRTFNSFAAAVSHATQTCREGRDYWGEVSVFRQVLHLDPGTRRTRWLDEHRWFVTRTGIAHNVLAELAA